MQDQFAKFHNSSLSTRGRIARPLENDPNLTSRDYYDLERVVYRIIPLFCNSIDSRSVIGIELQPVYIILIHCTGF